MNDVPDTSRISFTALYTGHVWYRHGLGDPALYTRKGEILYGVLAPFNALSNRMVKGLTLETMLLQRHKLIDARLSQAIEDQGIRQVLEVAAGYSPRGIRVRKRFTDLDIHYVEADLPEMAHTKGRLLENAGYLSDRHQMETCNALAAQGPESIPGLIATHFDTQKPVAVITEGLVNYFPEAQLRVIWQNIAGGLAQSPWGVYFSDMSLDMRAHPGSGFIYTFKKLLDIAARGSTHMHFSDKAACLEALAECGFTDAELLNPQDYAESLDLPPLEGPPVVHVIEARVGNA